MKRAEKLLKIIVEAKKKKETGSVVKQADFINKTGQEYYYPHNAFNKSQLKSLAVNQDYRDFIGGDGGVHGDVSNRVYVRKDKDPNVFYVANGNQKHMLKLHMNNYGKIKQYTVYKKADEKKATGWEIHKHVTADELKEGN